MNLSYSRTVAIGSNDIAERKQASSTSYKDFLLKIILSMAHRRIIKDNECAFLDAFSARLWRRNRDAEYQTKPDANVHTSVSARVNASVHTSASVRSSIRLILNICPGIRPTWFHQHHSYRSSIFITTYITGLEALTLTSAIWLKSRSPHSIQFSICTTRKYLPYIRPTLPNLHTEMSTVNLPSGKLLTPRTRRGTGLKNVVSSWKTMGHGQSRPTQ